MSILILLFCFIAIFFTLGILFRPGIKDLLISTVLVFSLLLVLITELLSIFHQLNFPFLLISWLVILIANSAYLFVKKDELIQFAKNLSLETRSTLNKLNRYDRFLLYSAITVLLLTFIQGIVYPPNNWDSMTYHLGRITNWISHESVAHYPTHIIRQLFQPPFAEFAITHFNILSFGDYFSNSVQLIYLIFSVVAIISILEQLGLPGKFKSTAAILAIVMPEVILQASSTQNDIVVSFFILTAFYFCVRAMRVVSFATCVLFGISVGLALLTKGTAYIFVAPILLVFASAILTRLVKTKNYALIGYSIIAGLICIAINLGHYTRNYNFSHSILGVNSAYSKTFSAQNITPKLLVSNILKNAGLHLGPFPFNKISDKVIYKLHLIAGVDLNDPNISFPNIRYSGGPDFPNHEDAASNTIHFILLVLSLLLIGSHLVKRRIFPKLLLIYIGVILLQSILFCAYLKWQPWSTRLHTPVFLLSIPLVCYAAGINNKYFEMLNGIIPVTIIFALGIMLFNSTRPFLHNRYTSTVSISDERYKKYFANRPELFDEYNAVVQEVNNSGNKNIGLLLGEDAWEYPIFTEIYSNKVNPIHINVFNGTQNIQTHSTNIDCIVSTITSDSAIVFKGERYRNTDGKHKFIWVYEKVK